MIDVSRLITDPDFCEPFVIRKKPGKWQDGEFITTPVDKRVTGIVEPTTGDDLEQVPEGDRVSGMVTFYTKDTIELTYDDHLADEIIWRHKLYKAITVLDWSRHGFYKTIASLVEVIQDDDARGMQ